MDKIKVGIAGAAGYTAGELLRILLHHPNVGTIQAQSESQTGKPVSSIHTDLIGSTNIVFIADLDRNLDVVFLCKGHGQSKGYLEENPHLLDTKVIDLSQDYRLEGDHDFVYGLPEMNADAIRNSQHIANPGCFATSIQLGILPAVKAGLVSGEIHVSGITGATGAGQSLSATSHFPWRNDNASVYKAFVHQHLLEINQSCKSENSTYTSLINFIPYRGAFSRGIITSSYFNTDPSEDDLIKAYQDYYQDQPFTHVIDGNPDLKMVTNTNKAVIGVSKSGSKALVVSVIDNLLKGASGQAVQNMNLTFDWEETTGLGLKGNAF